MPPAARRAAILEALAPAIAEAGEAVTTKRLAELAGVSEGTIFNVFDDKEALIDAVVDATIDPAPLEIAIARIDPTLPFETRLISATELLQRRMIEIWKLFNVLGGRKHRHPRELPVSRELAAMFAAEPDRVRLSPDEAARRLRAMTMAMTHPFLNPSPATPHEIVDAFLHGVATHRRRRT